MDLLRKRKLIIEDFWKRFGPRKNNGVGFSEEEKLDALVELSKVVIFHRTIRTWGKVRRKFAKFYKKYFKEKCFVCQEEMNHRHHIIAVNHGGYNGKANIIALCEKHHKMIHPWMNKKQKQLK